MATKVKSVNETKKVVSKSKNTESKTKKISINAFERAIKENYSPTVTVDWNGLSVVIKKNLSLSEVLVFVDGVTRSCFSSDDGSYRPELMDCAIRGMAIELYTNISMPSDVNKQHDLLYASDIWHVVLDNINQEQFNQMILAIDKKTNNVASERISVINKQIAELYSSMDYIQDQLKSIFDGIGADDIKNLIGAISNSGIDEEKLMKAYIANR